MLYVSKDIRTLVFFFTLGISMMVKGQTSLFLYGARQKKDSLAVNRSFFCIVQYRKKDSLSVNRSFFCLAQYRKKDGRRSDGIFLSEQENGHVSDRPSHFCIVRYLRMLGLSVISFSFFCIVPDRKKAG